MNEITNQAINYIMEHIREEITVEDVADHCHFSKYYFNRQFKEETGESIYAFIKRIKLEQSALKLKVEPQKRITDIAIDYGYSSSNYSSAFRQHHNMSPATFRKTIMNKTISINPNWEKYSPQVKDSILTYEQCQEKITIEVLEDMFVIYERIKGNYHDLEEKWCNFCEKYKAYITDDVLLLESTYDDPVITNADGCLYDLCITTDQSCPLENTRICKGGKFAVFHFKGHIWELYPIHESLLGIWLPKSNHAIDDRLAFDIYRFIDTDTMYMEIDICIPIK